MTEVWPGRPFPLGAPHLLHLARNDLAVFLFPLPNALHKFLAPNRVARRFFFEKLALDHQNQTRIIVLGNVIRRPGTDGDHRLLLADDSGNDDKRDIGPGFLQHAQRLQALKPGHRMIGQNQVPRLRRQRG